MKLQLAMDLFTIEEALSLLGQVDKYIDIAEVGTPFILKYGVQAVTDIKKSFPKLLVLADMKIMDGGEIEADLAFESGADIVTVLAAAHDSTIKNTVKSAKKHNKAVMVDMIAVDNIEKRAKEIDEFGVDYICVHTAFDIQHTGAGPLQELMIVKGAVTNAKLAVAGGITLNSVEDVSKAMPSIVIVGGGINNADNRIKTAEQIKKIMNDNEVSE